MVLKDILSISGQPGLYKFIAQGKNAIVVEHLETKKRSSAFGSAKVSSLEEISVFTQDEDLPLGKVFDMIYEKENSGATIDFKSNPEKLKAYFGEVIPGYDRDRVYNSDIRKILQWYNILHTLNLLVPDPQESEDEKEPESGEEAKSAKKTPARKKPSGTAKAD